MALFPSKPKVRALARAGDVAGLRAAAAFEDLLPNRDGSVVDLGAPVREQAVRALGELDSPELDGAVVKALTDPSDRVRMAAVRVCAEHGDAALLATAIGSIPPGAGEARVLAITELLEGGAIGMSRLLAEALVFRVGPRGTSEEDLMLLEAVLETEARSEAPSEVVEALVEALAEESEDVADRAEAFLAHLAPASVGRLIEELKRGRAAKRAASALGRAKDVRALAPLTEALELPDAELRAECCVALGELRDPAAVEALLRASSDPEHVVRAQAGWALDHLGMLAVVVGVSTVLKPMLSPGGHAVAGGHELLGLGNGNGNGAAGNGATAGAAVGRPVAGLPAGAGEIRPSLLRRLARLIDRVEDVRGGSGARHPSG